MTRSLFTALFAAAAAAVAAPALAQGVETATAHVRYADLDLATAVGAKGLAARVEAAASALCSHEGMFGSGAYEGCRASVRGRFAAGVAQARANAPAPTVLARR